MPFPGFRILFQQFVDNRVEVHQPSIFSEIVFWFPQKHVGVSVASLNRDLSGFLQGLHDLNFIIKAYATA
jgi:hypothetical protein